MAEVKNVVPNFEEFSKNPEQYMSQLNQPAQSAQMPAQPAAQPAAQPGTDSILGAEAGAQPAQPAAQPATAVGPEGAQGTNPPAEKGAQAGAGTEGTEGPLV